MKTITTMILAAGILIMSACTSKKSEVELGTIENSETISRDSSRFELAYDFEYLADYHDKEILMKIQRSMASDFFGNEYLMDTPEATAKAYRDSIVSRFEREVADFQEKFPERYPWNWFQKLRSHIGLVKNKKILVYTIENAYFMGGAHGLETKRCSNYDLATGEKLTLNDLFTPEGKASLAEEICEEILMNHGVNEWDSLMSKTCYSAQEEIGPAENFELSDTHIIFHYNPYEIACYAQGSTEVKLALENLGGVRKKFM